MRRALRYLAVACAALLLPSSAVAAEPSARFAPAAKWPERELVLTLPAKRTLQAGDIKLAENGVPVRGARVAPESANRKRGVVLVIDTSLTMHGEAIREAMIAARSFAKRRPESTPMGVVLFSREPRVALAPTTDRRRIKTALAVGPELSRGTRIYDAAAAALAALDAAQLTSGAVIVLSDGAEAKRGSAITRAQLAARANAQNVRIFGVGLRSRSFDSAALRAMAGGTGGQYGEAARPRDLPPIFAAIGEQLSSEHLVSYRSQVPAGTATTLRVTVAGGPALTVQYKAPNVSFAPAGPGHAVASRGLDATRVAMAGIAAFLLLALVGYLVLRPVTRSVVTRVGEFAHVEPLSALPAEDGAAKAQHTRSPRWKRWEELVELSEIGLSPAALTCWTLVGMAIVAWYTASALHPVVALVALGVPFITRWIVTMRVARRRIAFEDQLPDNLQVMASALRAGFSFSAALATMADDAAEPFRSELRRASADEQLGADIADCLKAVGQRMDNQEIEYVGIVAKMQREAGGNTADVLDNVVATIRERLKLRRMVRVLTAQGRLSGVIVACIPVALIVGMTLLHPGYLDPMFASSVGVALFVVSLLMILAGWLVIRKVVDVKE